MCNNNANNDSCRCIAEILSVINVLQQNACTSDTCLDTCDRKFLGCGTNTLNCNTRPVMLTLCNGTRLQMPTTKDDITEENLSPVFRVEKVEGCCCTFRVLTPNGEEAENPYSATNSFFTVNLNCVCSLRCLSDTYVECI